MAVSWRSAQAHTEAKYPAAGVKVESMVFSDLVDSINQAYKDRDLLALQYLGTCLSSSVFGRQKGSSKTAKDLPKTLARLLEGINSAQRQEDFEAMHHLGNSLATISVFEHAAQAAVREKTAVHERIAAALEVGPWTGSSLETLPRLASNSSSPSAAMRGDFHELFLA